MKIRNGFVSNSSSSSFVLLLPLNYELIESEIEKEIEIVGDDYYHKKPNVESIQKAFKQLKKHKQYWEQDGEISYNILRSLLDKFVIAGVDQGPDSESIVLANRKKVREILKIKVEKKEEE